jgi:hypothetical protein
MRIGIIGAGHISGTLAKLFVDAGHEVAVRNSRGPGTLVRSLGAPSVILPHCDRLGGHVLHLVALCGSWASRLEEDGQSGGEAVQEGFAATRADLAANGTARCRSRYVSEWRRSWGSQIWCGSNTLMPSTRSYAGR